VSTREPELLCVHADVSWLVGKDTSAGELYVAWTMASWGRLDNTTIPKTILIVLCSWWYL